jgi:hypothetical protein
MKFIFIVLFFSSSIFASNTIYYPSKIQDGEIFFKGYLRNPDLKTFCRNGLQWVYIQNANHSGGLSLDYKLIDKNNPAKGISHIPCNY